MKFLRRQFLHLTASAIALPTVKLGGQVFAIAKRQGDAGTLTIASHSTCVVQRSSVVVRQLK